jgi:hypothetical protein
MGFLKKATKQGFIILQQFFLFAALMLFSANPQRDGETYICNNFYIFTLLKVLTNEKRGGMKVVQIDT